MVGSVQHFSVRFEPDGCCAILHLEGELDIASVGVAEKAIADASPYEHLIFDCELLTFLDSSGIRTFLAAHEQWDGNVAVIHAHRIVDKAITITGLADILHLKNTLEEAKALFHP